MSGGLQQRSRGALDALFGSEESKQGERSITSLPAEQLVHFRQHPFRMDQSEIEELAQSIRREGILEPVHVRAIGRNKYEIISGHRRTEGAKLAGYAEIPCIIEELDDDRAICFMVEANMHHRKLLPSERATAYRMELEALERLGIESPFDAVAEQESTSSRSIYRYYRLSFLVIGLMELVDKNKLKVQVGAVLSYLEITVQDQLLELIQTKAIVITEKVAGDLKKAAKASDFNLLQFFDTVTKKKKPPSAVSIKYTKLKHYFPEGIGTKDIEQRIVIALEFYNQHHQ